jgi:hypothetical protein
MDRRDAADPLAAFLVAWHNRHPLARRVTVAHVRAIGVVALPFADDPTASKASRPGAEPGPDPTDEPAVERTMPLGAFAVDAGPAGPAEHPTAEPPPGPTSADGPGVAPRDGAASGGVPRAGAWRPGLVALRAWLAGVGAKAARHRGSAGDDAGASATPAFAADAALPWPPGRIAEFALRHGSASRPGSDGWPLRELDPVTDRPVRRLYLRTAAIEVDGMRVRVLVGDGDRPAILGRRLTSPVRAASGSFAAAALLVGAGLAMRPNAPGPVDAAAPPARVAALGMPPGPGAAAGVPPPAAELAPPAPTPAAAPASASARPDPDAPHPTASAPASHDDAASTGTSATGQAVPSPDAPAPDAGDEMRRLAAAVSGASAPVAAPAPPAAPMAPPAAGAPRLVADIVPRLTAEERAAARAEGQRLRDAASGAPLVAAADGRHYALVARTTRGRAAAEVMQSLIDSAASAAPFTHGPRTEVMAVAGGWRAVWWPFPARGDAEQAKAVLAAYGIDAEIVDF